jgi:hypothetical protein
MSMLELKAACLYRTARNQEALAKRGFGSSTDRVRGRR